MNYIDEGSTLPVPYNMIPTPKSAKYLMTQLQSLCLKKQSERYIYDAERRQTFIEVVSNHINLSNVDIETQQHSTMPYTAILYYPMLLLRTAPYPYVRVLPC